MNRVALIGCGGLGVPAAWTLALAGVRHFRLIDPDRVELSNLHRQVLYATADVGRLKAEVLAEILRAQFDADVDVQIQRLTPENTGLLLENCDAALEGSDDALAKFAVNDWAIQQPRERLAVIAAAIGRAGQWLTVTPTSSCYRCIFEQPPPVESLETCASAGVLGPLTGQVGAYAALSLVHARTGHADAAVGALMRLSPRGLLRTHVARAPGCLCA